PPPEERCASYWRWSPARAGSRRMAQALARQQGVRRAAARRQDAASRAGPPLDVTPPDDLRRQGSEHQHCPDGSLVLTVAQIERARESSRRAGRFSGEARQQAWDAREVRWEIVGE